MEQSLYNTYVQILNTQLVPAMGCTEPIAVAYAAALAAQALRKKTGPAFIHQVHISVSSNIIKNVKSVIVPNTDGLHGLEAAAAAGIGYDELCEKMILMAVKG